MPPLSPTEARSIGVEASVAVVKHAGAENINAIAVKIVEHRCPPDHCEGQRLRSPVDFWSGAAFPREIGSSEPEALGESTRLCKGIGSIEYES